MPPDLAMPELTQEFSDLVLQVPGEEAGGSAPDFHEILKALNPLKVYKNDPAVKK